MSHQTSPQSSEIPTQNSHRTEKSFYDLAEILVCDPVASNRAATRSALYSLGCRHIEIGGGVRDFLDALERRPPDLALFDAQVGESELCRAIREVRHGEHSYNPFTIIIVTAWIPKAGVATEILNSGADGLLLRPFSAAVLDQRIRAHVMQHKPFVVTDDYIGPERRAAGRPTSALTIVPPNSFKMKVEERGNPDEAIRRFNIDLRAACLELARAKQQLNSSRLLD
jgi:CheY-like chemotaxis protein